jgi:hypothetical protein
MSSDKFKTTPAGPKVVKPLNNDEASRAAEWNNRLHDKIIQAKEKLKKAM